MRKYCLTATINKILAKLFSTKLLMKTKTMKLLEIADGGCILRLLLEDWIVQQYALELEEMSLHSLMGNAIVF